MLSRIRMMALRIGFGLALALLAMRVAAEAYPMGATVTDTTGYYSLLPDDFGLTTYIEEYVDGVIVDRFHPPYERVDKPNGVYEYRYIWEWTIEGQPSTQYYHIGTTWVTVDRPVAPSVPGAIEFYEIDDPNQNMDSDGYVIVGWSVPAGNPTVYEMYRRLIGSDWELAYSGPDTYVGQGLANGDFEFIVRACNSIGCSDFTAGRTVIVMKTPGTPGSLSAVNLSHPATGSDADGAFGITWPHSTDAGPWTVYYLQEKINAGAFMHFAGPIQNYHAISGKGAGTYQYRAIACTPLACSDWSAPITVQVLFPPSAPGLLQITGISDEALGIDRDGAVTVSWVAASGNPGYELHTRVNSGAWSVRYSGPSNVQQLSLPSGFHEFQARSCNAVGCSAFTNIAGVNVLLPPSVPSAITVTNLSHASTNQDIDGAYTLSWPASSGAQTYFLEERINGGQWFRSDLTTTTRAFSGKASGTYEYRVGACIPASCSGTSPVKSVQVLLPPGVPSLNAPANDPDGTYTVSWSATGTISSYTLQRMISTGAWTTIQETAATSRNESGLGNGTYSYRVRACNALSCSNWSTTRTVQVVIPTVAIAPFPSLAAATAAGALPFTSRVNEKGGFALQLPLDLPSGVAGLQPALSLTFDSLGNLYDPMTAHSNNRWQLGGIWSIQECMDYTQLCLNGNGILITENPELSTPPANQRYRVAKHQDALVIRKVDAGAAWFAMKLGGREYRFGQTSAGRKMRGTAIEQWYLQEVVDEFGNVMTVEYQTLSTGYADKFPAAIRYGGYRIELVYNRITSSSAARVGLHTIRSVVNEVTTSEYRLIRGAVDEQGLPLVNAVQKCGFSQTGTSASCMAATTVDSINPASGPRRIVMTDGTGATSEVTLYPRGELATVNAVMGASESPFPFPTGLLTTAFNLGGSDYQWVAIQRKVSDGIGGTRISDFAYRYAGLNNDVLREKLPDGTYLYTSYLADMGYGSPNDGQVLKDARLSGIAGAAGSRKLAFLENEWEMLVWDKHNGARPNHILKYPILKSRKQHLLDDNGSIAGGSYTSLAHTWTPATGVLSQTVATTTTGYDPSGLSIAANLQRTVVETTSYSNNVSNWIVGFVEERTTQATVPGRAGSRTVSTEYQPHPGYVTHKLGTTTVSGDSGSGPVTQSVTTNSYDSMGNLSGVTVSGADFATRSETFSSFIDNRFPTMTSRPTGTGYSLQGTVTYDLRFGAPASVTDVNGLTGSVTRDNFGREIQRVTPKGAVITTTYERCTGLCGSLRSFDRGTPRTKTTVTTTHPAETNKGAPTTIAYFDEHGRTIREEREGFASSQWNAVDYGYDALGRLEQRSLPYEISASETPRYVIHLYDVLSRLTRVNNPDGSYTTYAYQQSSDKYRVTRTDNRVGPAGLTKTLSRVEEYDSIGQLRLSTDASGAPEQVTTSYQYDQNGYLDRAWVNGNTNTTVYTTNDAFGRVVSVEDPNTGLVSHQFDGLGQLRFRMDADGMTTRYDYDLLGRVYQRTDNFGASGAVVNRWDYDTKKVGLLSARSAPGFTEELAYDSFAQVQGLTTSISVAGYSGAFTKSITRDNYGRARSITYPSGVIASHVYNPRGYRSELQDGRNNAMLSRINSMNGFGAVTSQTLGNGLQGTQTFDPATGYLTSVRAGTLHHQTYQWWSDGSLYQRTRPDISATETFTYDALGRLDYAATTSPGGTRNLDYSYDKLGNLMSKVEGATNVSGYAYATAKPHRMIGVTIAGAAHSYSYDNKGNITFTDAAGLANDRSLTYDATGKPTLVVKGDPTNPAARESFRYDPDGVRFLNESLNKTVTPAVTDRTVYLYNGAFEVLMLGSGTTTRIEKTYLGDVLHIREIRNTGTVERFEYLHRDHLGSINVLTSSSGALVGRNYLDSFGTNRSDNWIANGNAPALSFQQTHTNRGFTGHQHVYSTGLIHMNGRIYDPQLGRFMSADPIVQSPNYSQSYNRYAYVFNSPLSLTDPSGYMAGDGCDDECGTRGVIETVVTNATRIRPPALPPILIQAPDPIRELPRLSELNIQVSRPTGEDSRKKCTISELLYNIENEVRRRIYEEWPIPYVTLTGTNISGSGNSAKFSQWAFGFNLAGQPFMQNSIPLNNDSVSGDFSIIAGEVGINVGVTRGIVRDGVTTSHLTQGFIYTGGATSFGTDLSADGGNISVPDAWLPRALRIGTGLGVGSALIDDDIKTFTGAGWAQWVRPPTQFYKCR